MSKEPECGTLTRWPGAWSQDGIYQLGPLEIMVVPAKEVFPCAQCLGFSIGFNSYRLGLELFFPTKDWGAGHYLRIMLGAWHVLLAPMRTRPP